MTHRHRRGLRMSLVAFLVASVPLTTALATTATGLDAEEPTPRSTIATPIPGSS